MRYSGRTGGSRNGVGRSLRAYAKRCQSEQAPNPGDDGAAAPSPKDIACLVVLDNCVQRDLSVKANYSSSTYRPCSASAESEASSMAGS